MSRLPVALGFGGRIQPGSSWRSCEFGQRLLDRVTGVKFRVRFASGAVPCDSLDDRFGATRRVYVIDTSADVVRIPILGECIERDHIGIHRCDGFDDVLKSRLAHVRVNLCLVLDVRRGQTKALHSPPEIFRPVRV